MLNTKAYLHDLLPAETSIYDLLSEDALEPDNEKGMWDLFIEQDKSAVRYDCCFV
jgi:hypothetical protein